MNTPNKTPRLFIGIDAGRETGLAVWDAQAERFAVLTMVDFWRALDFVLAYAPDQVLVVVEDPALNAPLFDKGVRSARKRERIAQNVGGVKRESKLLADGLARKGYQVRRIRPRTRKLDADAFRRLTKHQSRTSQHSRDAAMLVFGLKRVPDELDSPGALSLSLYAPPQ